MFNSVYKRCNSNDANAWRDTGAGELHATFFDSPSNGSHALPPTAQTVAQVVAPPMEQDGGVPEAWHGGHRRRWLEGSGFFGPFVLRGLF